MSTFFKSFLVVCLMKKCPIINQERNPYYNPELSPKSKIQPWLQNCLLYDLKLPKQNKNWPWTSLAQLLLVLTIDCLISIPVIHPCHPPTLGQVPRNIWLFSQTWTIPWYSIQGSFKKKIQTDKKIRSICRTILGQYLAKINESFHKKLKTF